MGKSPKDFLMKKLLLLLPLLVALNAKEQKIVFAAGCFWGVEKHFEGIRGVKDAHSGYAGGNYIDPTYKKVLKYRTFAPKGLVNYAESVEVIYDDAIISSKELIKDFWELHDPTQKNQQGNDKGNNYRSAIYYTTDEQMQSAIKTKNEYQNLLSQASYGHIVTEIKALEKFYPAEPFHQDYLQKNPNGYCPNHATGVKFSKKNKVETQAIHPLRGKEIVVIDADGCPFCDQFKNDVTSSYQGKIPLRTTHADRLKGFKISTKLDATPTILLLEDGKEVYAHKGYLASEEFYKLIGEFALGNDSEAFKVAFNQGTDASFCKQYDLFKNTPDGTFVDKLSGEVLFDTRDRFKSGTGWLSFYKAVDGSTIEIADTSYGMKRIEVRAKTSGIHLGHVFEDAPGGKRRFCINATVLDFVPRNTK